jgi:hypothetical protein
MVLLSAIGSEELAGKGTTIISNMSPFDPIICFVGVRHFSPRVSVRLDSLLELGLGLGLEIGLD